MSIIYPFYPQQYDEFPVLLGDQLYGGCSRELSSYHRPHALREQERCYNGFEKNQVIDPLDPLQQRQQDYERIQNLRLIDDEFMNVVFIDKACAELLLRVILEQDDLMAQSVETQRWMQNLHGRSARLDVLAKDATGNSYDVEVQRADAGAGTRRARYYSGLIDANVTNPGIRFQNLHKNYVIFITENDFLGGGLPIYHIHRTIDETGERFNDDSHIIYVNSQIQDATALGRLMHDFWCTSHEDMYYSVLAERVQYFKTNKEGQISMCNELERMRNEVAEAAARRAEKARSIQIACTMLIGGEPADKIVTYTGLTLDEVKALDTRQPA